MEPLIIESDYHALRELIERGNGEGANLGRRIEQSKVVKEHAAAGNIIRINSTVEIHDLSGNSAMKIRIVLPAEADLSRKWISVFAPLSVALLGHRSGDVVEWQVTGGIKKLAIGNVINQ